MEPNKVQGKRSLTAKARDEADEEGEEEEEEDEIDDDNDVVSGGRLGFQSGGDEYMVRKRRQVIAGGGKARGSGSGSGAAGSTVRPGCQADSCHADLSQSKHYHRRHKICEVHAKAPVVLVAGLQQRFCQQCSRFHGLPEFDSTKKSCRRRLAGHNERRRKTSSELITREGSS